MPFHLPYHKYFGPGTSDFKQKPFDSDDAIAQQHDNNYSKALVSVHKLN